MTCFQPSVDAITGKRKYKWFVVLLVNVSIHRFPYNRFAVSQLSREKRRRFLKACSYTFDCCSACLEFLIGMPFQDLEDARKLEAELRFTMECEDFLQ
ncbi:hypothetical protein TNCT_681701 [Trichonephila clavata]|uniref:Uncharacterized protein n=1 Tax=Trichonephila clavata TaxID=2740835 RepID=A0A8X6H1Z8_TRICU|nr:hypothetical protein TNCT_681701 [Trichonephila clavata]